MRILKIVGGVLLVLVVIGVVANLPDKGSDSNGQPKTPPAKKDTDVARRKTIFKVWHQALKQASEDPEYVRLEQQLDIDDRTGKGKETAKLLERMDAIDKRYTKVVLDKHRIALSEAVKIDVEGTKKRWPKR